MAGNWSLGTAYVELGTSGLTKLEQDLEKARAATIRSQEQVRYKTVQLQKEDESQQERGRAASIRSQEQVRYKHAQLVKADQEKQVKDKEAAALKTAQAVQTGAQAATAASTGSFGAIGGVIGAAMGGPVGAVIGGIVGNAVSGALDTITGTIKSAVGLANPIKMERFQMAVDDSYAVLGRVFVPVLEYATQGVRLFGDFLATILPTSSQVREGLAGLQPVIAEIREAMAGAAPLLRGAFLAGLSMATRAIVFMAESALNFVRMVGEIALNIPGMSFIARKLFGDMANVKLGSSFGASNFRTPELAGIGDIWGKFATETLRSSVGGADPAKETADNTKKTAENTEKLITAMNAVQAAQSLGLMGSGLSLLDLGVKAGSALGGLLKR